MDCTRWDLETVQSFLSILYNGNYEYGPHPFHEKNGIMDMEEKQVLECLENRTSFHNLEQILDSTDYGIIRKAEERLGFADVGRTVDRNLQLSAKVHSIASYYGAHKPMLIAQARFIGLLHAIVFTAHSTPYQHQYYTGMAKAVRTIFECGDTWNEFKGAVVDVLVRASEQGVGIGGFIPYLREAVIKSEDLWWWITQEISPRGPNVRAWHNILDAGVEHGWAQYGDDTD